MSFLESHNTVSESCVKTVFFLIGYIVFQNKTEFKQICANKKCQNVSDGLNVKFWAYNSVLEIAVSISKLMLDT